MTDSDGQPGPRMGAKGEEPLLGEYPPFELTTISAEDFAGMPVKKPGAELEHEYLGGGDLRVLRGHEAAQGCRCCHRELVEEREPGDGPGMRSKS